VARYRRALIATAVAACAPAAPPPPAPVAQPAPLPPVATVSAVDAGPPAPPPKASRCKPVGANEVSDDDHPVFTGLGPSVDLNEWMTARGSNADAAYLLYGNRHGESRDGASMSMSSQCRTAKLGDPAEDALLCEGTSRRLLTANTLFAFVVRNKKPLFLFEAPLGVAALDWPDSHQLDLAFVLHTPTAFEVRDRAPDGSTLVLAPSVCLAEEKAGQNPDPQAPRWGYPAELHDCARAKKIAAAMHVQPDGDPGMNESVVAARAFIMKACTKELGFWTWKNGQFVRDTTAKH
jgi:hypothetical protein